MITSGLNKNFTLSTSYSFHNSTYHKSFFFLLLFKPQHSAKIFHKEFNTTQHTSQFTEHTNLPRRVQIILTISEHKPRYSNTSFQAYFIFRGHSSREPTSIICNESRVTYFIQRTHTGTSGLQQG